MNENKSNIEDNLNCFEENKKQWMKYTGESGQKHDQDKPRFDLLPPFAIEEMAKVMTFGANKYAPNNWQKVENHIERYTAALLRHTFAMMQGETHDPETGLLHSAHAMCCAAFIAEFQKCD